MLTIKQNPMKYRDKDGNMQDCGMLLGSPTTVITQVTPLFAESVEELKQYGDTSKVYVLPDGYIYAYKAPLDGSSSKQWENTGIKFVASDSGGK